MSVHADSVEKNETGALFLLALAEARGDSARADVARSVLRACGNPLGEGAPDVSSAVAAVPAPTTDNTLAPRQKGGPDA